jgi:hypothetical protein
MAMAIENTKIEIAARITAEIIEDTLRCEEL